ncbi:hypothetical protein BDM02DRAFT_3222131 [Thelephora ganbajun]|uniref:Uncharacterized protein n=1 Tax=Thelephora ganbajun TaxID=370292 RepID=A0ACB6ZLY8_THEGA|nr:hypothetical protein BDM02DRAFT_3222131 [Thelephora ganbajun]
MVISWDLHLPTRRRPTKLPKPQRGRWETLTGWGDDWYDDGEEDDTENEPSVGTDGDVLGDVTASVRKRRKSSTASNKEEYWELDPGESTPEQPSVFRQCVQLHSDWVNDILLCNQAQTVVSASSDGTLKAWNPHAASDPSLVGSHSDYVRCLAYCQDQNWVASGSFDKSIKLWDLNRASLTGSDPLITLKSPDSAGSKSSVYAIAVDPAGSVIASGTPERVIRTWDPRSGKRTAKLVGHTDNIRAILISADGKYLLTGSADASVKLWSLSAQKCIHAFTHHTESVWSLFSSHPSLEVFYSGDRSGLICRVDVEGTSDISEGECIVFSQSSDGVNKIIAMDDQLVWAASGSSSVARWKVPPRRNARLQLYNSPSLDPSSAHSLGTPGLSGHRKHSASIDTFATARTYTPPPGPRVSAPSIHGSVVDADREDTLYGIPYKSMVRLISVNETFTPYVSHGRDPEIATLYSAASVMSVPRLDGRPHMSSVLQNTSSLGNASPMRSDTLIGSAENTPALYPSNSARNEYEDREVASEAEPLLGAPDRVIQGDTGLVRSIILNNRMHALTVDTAGEVAVWDIIRAICLGKFVKDDVSAASHSDSGSISSDDSDKNPSPREALETVRERIEGQAVVNSWSSVDTKMGLLTVHLNDRCFEAEIYADEAGYGPEKNFGDELRLNISKWLLRNLFLGFVREQQRTLSPRRSKDSGSPQEHTPPHRGVHRGVAPTHIDINGSMGRRRSSSDTSRKSHSPSAMVVSSPSMVPAVPPLITGTKGASPLLAPVIPLYGASKDSTLPTIPQSPQTHPSSSDMTPMPSRFQHTPAPGTPREGSDYFSHRLRSGSISTTAPGDDLKTPSQDTFSGGSGSGLMGRLRNFGKSSSRRVPSDVLGSGTSTIAGIESTRESSVENIPASTIPTPLQLLQANVSIPPSSEAPLLVLPQNTVIYVSEETLFGWTTAYRGTVGTTGLDARLLEKTMPVWLLEYLLTNRVPAVPVIKVGFVLLPYPARKGEEQLPDLLNTSQSKLTASRFLRVRKLTNHVQDKLARIAAGAGSTATTPRSSVDALGRSSPPTPLKHRGPRAEDIYEILCNDTVLPLDMTLAAVKQYIWRQAAELTMYYRRRIAVVV